MSTPKQELLELKFDGDIRAAIATWLEDGSSWRDIQRNIERRTGLRVSHESLRIWYGRTDVAA